MMIKITQRRSQVVARVNSFSIIEQV